MGPRDTEEEHRASTPLELLFDLCFVVAVSQAAAQLHAALGAGHFHTAVVGYLLVFFAIWWAWVNFTWFASAYDVDDLLYRLLTFVQIVGVLILAAGVDSAFTAGNFAVMTVGYVVMRIAMVAQWLRAASGDPAAPAGCPALRGSHLHPPGRLGGPAVPAARGRPDRLLRPGGLRDARAGLGRTGGERGGHAVAPGSHQRALRALHPDRPRGVHRRGHGGHPRRQLVTWRVGRARGGGRRGRAPRLLDLVVVLRAPLRGGVADVAASWPSSGATGTMSSSARSAPSVRGCSWPRRAPMAPFRPPRRPRRGWR